MPDSEQLLSFLIKTAMLWHYSELILNQIHEKNASSVLYSFSWQSGTPSECTGLFPIEWVALGTESTYGFTYQIYASVKYLLPFTKEAEVESQ